MTMRWEDERYVRVYTRDTVDWLSLSFHAQALVLMLFRKADRAGLISLGKVGKRGVAGIVGHPSLWKDFEAALEELLADGCLVLTEAGLLFPNFIEAQETPSNDAARKRTHRERARDQAAAGVTPRASRKDVTPVAVPVTLELSRPAVTPGGHAGAETPNRAVLCRTEPDRAVPEKTRAPPARPVKLAEPVSRSADASDALESDLDDASRGMANASGNESGTVQATQRPEKGPAPVPAGPSFAERAVREGSHARAAGGAAEALGPGASAPELAEGLAALPVREPEMHQPAKTAEEARTRALEGQYRAIGVPVDLVRQALGSTRAGGQIADSLWLGVLTRWTNHPPASVKAGCETYLGEGHAVSGKGEKYLQGIIGGKAKEAARAQMVLPGPRAKFAKVESDRPGAGKLEHDFCTFLELAGFTDPMRPDYGAGARAWLATRPEPAEVEHYRPMLKRLKVEPSLDPTHGGEAA